MSLKSMLAAHDDRALVALSSKGLTRRARRDVDAGKAEVNFLDKMSATISIDGHNVRLDSKGPLSADCSCAATSLCRHILSAVMVLNAAVEAVPIEAVEMQEDASRETHVQEDLDANVTKMSGVKESAPRKAREEILDLSEDALIKFAGADLNAALALAASVGAHEILELGLNLSISLADSPANVTFIAGQGLKGAAYKGPKTKARLVTAACAILIRRIDGQTLDIAATSKKELGLTVDEALAMGDVVKSSVKAVLTGVPAIAADKLFEQAIAARVQTAPRLTAQLRALAKQAMLATTRHIEYEPADFLQNSANTYALCQAISKDPKDVKLTGSLSRTYKPSDGLSLWMFGARPWSSAAGARGLTCYGYSPEKQDWFETTTARGAGMDLSFSASEAYEGVLWRAGTPRASMGKTINLPNLAISEDGQISPNMVDAGKISSKRLTLNTVEKQNIFIKNWSQLRQYIGVKLGAGIRRRAFPIPVLIQPKKYLEMQFDEMSQRYKWGVVDENNEVILLDFPAQDVKIAQHIQSAKKKICGVLLVARLDNYEITYEPVSILLNYKSELTVFNMGLDHIEYRRLLGKKILKISDFFPQFTPPQAVNYSTSLALLDDCLDTLVDVLVSPARKDQLIPLIEKCENAGLTILAQSLENINQDLKTDAILKSVYVLNETRQFISL